MLQSDLSAEVYKNFVMNDLEDLSCLRLHALEKHWSPQIEDCKMLQLIGQEWAILWERFGLESKIADWVKGRQIRQSGHLIGKDLMGSSVVRLVILIFWKHWKEKKNLTEQSNGEYLKEYYPNVWISTWQPICLVVSSNSRYQKGIASSAKINPKG